MRLLRIVSAGYEQGGVENGIVLTNEVFRQHGYVVKVISARVGLGLKRYSDYEFSEVPSRGWKKIVYAAFNVDAYKVTKKVLKDFKPDVVLLHTMSQPTAAVLFLLRRYPTILFVHGPEVFTKKLLPWYLPINAYKNGLYKVSDLTFNGRIRYYYFKFICGMFYKLGMRNVDKIIALSHYTLNLLKQQGLNASYLPNGAKILKPWPMPKDNSVLLYSGRLEKFKGVDDLIRAMCAIIKEEPNVTLHICGDGSYAEYLANLVKDLNLRESVEFMGHLNQDKLAKEYRSCAMLIVPSTWPETFGKVGVEAMSVGRPVVATNVGGVKDWLQNNKNGLLIQPNHPDQIAKAVMRLLRETENAKRMSVIAQVSSQQFSIEKMASNIEGVIKSLKSDLM